MMWFQGYPVCERSSPHLTWDSGVKKQHLKHTMKTVEMNLTLEIDTEIKVSVGIAQIAVLLKRSPKDTKEE